MKVKLRAAVFWFSNVMKGQRVTHSTRDLFWKYSQNSPFFFRPLCSWNDLSSPECSLDGWNLVLLYSFSVAQAEFFICCKAITGACKNAFFAYDFHVPRYEKDFQKCLIFSFFFQSAKTTNLRALLTRSENALLGNIFTSLCCNCDTKHACKRSF